MTTILPPYLHEIAHVDLPSEAKIELPRVPEGIMQSFEPPEIHAVQDVKRHKYG